MRLRPSLILLTLATLLPVVVFGVILSAILVDQNRTTFRRGAEARTLAMITAVDTAIRGSITTVQSLTFSPSLNDGDLDGFRDAASRLLASQADWWNINLALPSGEQTVNLMVPAGARAPSLADDDTFVRVLATGQPQVGGISVGQVRGQWAIPVRVPVYRTGEVKYILTAVLKPESITELLRAQRLPNDWVAMVIDRNHRLVARTHSADQSVGKPADESLRGALESAPSGWLRSRSGEDAPIYMSYRQSELSGWVFAMGIPAHVIERVEYRTAWVLAVGGLIAIGLAIGLALLIGRRISRPIAALAAATEAMGRGEPVAVPDQPAPDEIRSLAAALRTAAQAMREREQLIEREKEALRAADRAKDEFLAMLSHELRNPIAALTTAAHVLKVAPAEGPAATRARGVIDRQANHMSRLIEDLLDVSRIAMDKVALDRHIFDLADVVANVMQMLRSTGRLGAERVRIQTESVWVNADQARIEQVLANLVHNALKFTPADKEVRVAVRQEGADAVLEVADEGEGMAPELMKRVFEPFVQGERALDRGQGGLGLGLALVKTLTELHGGSVSAYSDGPGRGSVFTVRLPAVPGIERKAVSGAPERRKSRHVLIIEDNDDTREMLHTMLSLSGHRVSQARDGTTGLAIAEREHPDIALIDIGLPDIDGYEVARRMRAVPSRRRMALVALTGYGQPADQGLAFGAGFDAHLTKPVPPERLKQALAAFQ